ncbi:MAG: hypothetical protein KDA80_16205 [Planctomycetaceae bacterium]|nr:hypothetical protein [Planctomycetaceae bacterium]
MAIEFHCPYCTAAVRVGLDAAGKVGRCPKCETRIRVPSLNQISGKDHSAPAPVEDHEREHGVPFAQAPEELTERSEPVPPFLDPSGTSATFESPLDVTPRESHSSATKYLRRKKRQSPWGALLIPGVFFAIFILIGAGYWWVNQPKFSGRITGQQLSANQYIQIDLNTKKFAVPQNTFSQLVQEFQDRPADLRSNLVNLRLTGGPEGVTITLRPGSESDLVKVPVFELDALAKLYRDHFNEWDDRRLEEMQRSLNDMAENWLPLEESDKSKLLPEYREEVIYNAFVHGLGRLCEAIVYTGDTPVSYPCVHEDSEGNLYFLVPMKTREFDIRERNRPAEKNVLPASFKIRVLVKPSTETTLQHEQSRERGEVETPVEVIPFDKSSADETSALPDSAPPANESPPIDENGDGV